VTAAVQQTLPDLLEQLPANEDEWPEEIRRDLTVFVEATAQENGLIPNGACPACFGVSKQRWLVMAKSYQFKSWLLFGKRWYSRRQLEDFSKVDRDKLRGPKTSKNGKMMRILKETLADANKDDE